ncbi:MAG: rhodanese-like domain-containing protein [Granulosicoccus sp.]
MNESCQTEPELPFLNLSGYRFVELEHLPVLQADLYTALDAIGVKGTILLADEGINIALAATTVQGKAVRELLDADERFSGIWLKISESATLPFAKLKVRIRHEIIAFDGPDDGTAHNDSNRVARPTARLDRPEAPALPPKKLKAWLDEKRNFTLLDTRNTYEITSGTFSEAVDLGIEHFRHFKDAVKAGVADGSLDPAKPMVTFCTGGIRCEKAAPWLLTQGFTEVWQIEGGILNYFEECGDAHWQGDCFVFDDRVEIDTQLQPTGAEHCNYCERCHRALLRCTCQQPEETSVHR